MGLSSSSITSPTDILRGASRVPAPRTETRTETRDAPLRMSAGEASSSNLQVTIFRVSILGRLRDFSVPVSQAPASAHYHFFFLKRTRTNSYF